MDQARIRWLHYNGEAHVESLCLKAGLVPNKSFRDVEGWDFFVELPRKLLPLRARDSQPAPLKCFIQVKSSDDTFVQGVDIALNNWEQWTQNPLPVFIVLVGFSGMTQAQSLHLCHIDRERMIQTLQRIRSMDSKNNIDLSKKMRFAPRAEEELGVLDYKEVETRIRSAAGCDSLDYAAMKSNLLKTIGFDINRYRMKMQAEVSLEDTVDAFLGLKPITASLVEVSTIRFGIEILERSFQNAIMTMKPAVIASVRLVVRDRRSARKATLGGQVYAAPLPDIPEEFQKFKVEAGCFQAVYGNKGGTFHIDFRIEKLVRLDELIEQSTAIDILQSGHFQMSLESNGTKSDINPIGIVPRSEYFAQVASRAIVLKKAFEKSGVATNLYLSADQLFSQDTALQWLYLIHNKARVKIEGVDLPESIVLKNRRGLFATITQFRVGSETFLFPCIWNASFLRDGSEMSLDIRKCLPLDALTWEGDHLLEAQWETINARGIKLARKKPLLVYRQDVGDEGETATFTLNDDHPMQESLDVLTLPSTRPMS